MPDDAVTHGLWGPEGTPEPKLRTLNVDRTFNVSSEKAPKFVPQSVVGTEAKSLGENPEFRVGMRIPARSSIVL